MFIFRPKLYKDSRRATRHIFLFPAGKIIQRVFAVPILLYPIIQCRIQILRF